MDLTTAKSAVQSKFWNTKLLAEKHSPTALVVLGAVGVIGTAVLASRATLKLEAITDEAAQTLETIKGAKERGEELNYSDEDARRDTTIVYVQSAIKIAKLYMPAAIVAAGTISAIVGSHKMMTKRNAALAAAYQTVQVAFDRYRDSIREQFGPEVDAEIYRGKVVEEVEVKEDGTQVVSKHHVDGISVYARYFDEFNINWFKERGYNMVFVRAQQNAANDMLKSRGSLLLNDVYDMLGFERTQAGAVVGWVLGNGDDFVDFGLYDPNNEMAREFVNGYERSILLDFNVDGVVYNLIGSRV